MTMRRTLHKRTVDWRATLAANQRKTSYVIGLFILIYTSLGFLIDLYLYNAFEVDQFVNVFRALITFEVTPLVTLTMGGVALLSILITYALHDRLMLLGTAYHEINSQTAKTFEEQQLYHSIEELKIAAGLHYTPKVYLIDAEYMNAFASGYSEKSALIAITRGLLNKLDRSELQAVLAHELSHIRHGDIKLTLMASILSNLMLIIIDIFFYNLLYAPRKRRDDNKFFFIILVLRYVMPTMTILLMLYLSRTREYMADAGSVELLRDNQPLGRALLKIRQDHQTHRDAYRRVYQHQKHEEVRRAAYIFDPASMGLQAVYAMSHLFSTHPPIKARLKAIGYTIDE